MKRTTRSTRDEEATCSTSKEKGQKAKKPSAIANDLNSGVKSHLPPTYPEEDLSIFDRLDAYQNDILVDCKYCEVEQGFEHYLSENVCQKDWKAVWRSFELHCDILVKVKNALKFPNATVEIVEPFCCELSPNSGKSKPKTKDEVGTFLTAKKNLVKLMELHPVCDDSDNMDKSTSRDDGDESDEECLSMEETARALEHYRFFYMYIWRVLDEFQQTEGYFACQDLSPRIKIYYDVKEKKVSDTVSKLYTDTIKDYQEKYQLFQIKRDQLSSGSDASDTKTEANKHWAELGRLIKVLQKLDNPVTREQCQMRPNNAKVTHLVAEKFTPGLIESANLERNTTITQHKTLASALKSCFNLDTILIFPGKYSGKGFTEFSKDLTVKGAGQSPSDVIITYQQKSDAGIESTAFDLCFCNLTLEGQTPGSSCCDSVLLVADGQVTFVSCVIKSFAAGLRVVDNGKLKVDKCEIYDIATSCVVAELYTDLYMADSHIHHCGGSTASGKKGKKKTKTSKNADPSKAAILVEARLYGRSPYQTNIDLQGNKIEDTGGHGVWLQLYHEGEECMGFLGEKLESKSMATMEEFDETVLMAGVNWFTMQNQFKNNGGGIAYLEYINN